MIYFLQLFFAIPHTYAKIARMNILADKINVGWSGFQNHEWKTIFFVIDNSKSIHLWFDIRCEALRSLLLT